jgi:hypothetical protein
MEVPRPREQGVFDRADVAGPILLFRPWFSSAPGIRIGASECVSKADKFFSCELGLGSLRGGKVIQRRRIVNRGTSAPGPGLGKQRGRGLGALDIGFSGCVPPQSGPAFDPVKSK